MSKKKAEPEPAESPKGQIPVISLKGTAEYRDWLAAASKKTHIPAATITRLGHALWAKEHGLEPPPEK